jgi:hypothetical protein
MGYSPEGISISKTQRTISTFRMSKAEETIWLEGSPPHYWRKIPIALIDTDFSEQKAQTCENAFFDS